MKKLLSYAFIAILCSAQITCGNHQTKPKNTPEPPAEEMKLKKDLYILNTVPLGESIGVKLSIYTDSTEVKSSERIYFIRRTPSTNEWTIIIPGRLKAFKDAFKTCKEFRKLIADLSGPTSVEFRGYEPANPSKDDKQWLAANIPNFTGNNIKDLPNHLLLNYEPCTLFSDAKSFVHEEEQFSRFRVSKLVTVYIPKTKQETRFSVVESGTFYCQPYMIDIIYNDVQLLCNEFKTNPEFREYVCQVFYGATVCITRYSSYKGTYTPEEAKEQFLKIAHEIPGIKNVVTHF
ncbi:hypothetical protein HOD08_02940 [bacterium]|nr:hypothetical protein [bacterium]